ncbi:MAG: cupin domain-containing protein [Actinomycetota bacterium]
MAAELPHVRRIVTGHTGAGEATIVEDGPAPAEIRNPARPGFVLRNLWRTGEAPAPVGAPDSITEHEGLLPPSGGTILRVIDFPPDPTDPALHQRQLEATFRATYPDAEHTGSDRAQPHPGMHKTVTVDYAIVLHGAITAVLDDCETEMKAGDILVQRGTNHAWSNRSASPARVAFVLVDGAADGG